MLTDQQNAAVQAVTNAIESVWRKQQAPEHFVLEAVAGSGKSSTLATIVQTITEVHHSARILLLQFNQEACQQMKQRLEHIPKTQSVIDVHTIHSFGLRMLGNPSVDPQKLYKLWHRLVQVPLKHPDDARQEWQQLQRNLDHIRHSAWLPPISVFREKPLTLEMAMMEECLQSRDVIDQEDAVYHAIYFGARSPVQYDLVLVDEAQDLNDANHTFLRHCVAPVESPTIVCAVGDPAQAIYQFRGAHPQSLDKLRVLFQATQLNLSCCFRCPRRVVSVASHLYPSIQADPSAPLGSVDICRLDDRLDTWDVLLNLLNRIPPTESSLFVSHPGHSKCSCVACCCTNQCLLDVVIYLYHHPERYQGQVCKGGIRWAAPFILMQLQTALSISNRSLDELVCIVEESMDTGWFVSMQTNLHPRTARPPRQNRHAHPAVCPGDRWRDHCSRGVALPGLCPGIVGNTLFRQLPDPGHHPCLQGG